MDLTEIHNEELNAERLFQEARFSDALDIYKKIRKYGLYRPKIFLRLGDISKEFGNFPAAIEEYKRAAEAYARRGSVIKAISVCKKILFLDPESSGNIKGSIATISKQLKSKPVEPDLEKMELELEDIPEVTAIDARVESSEFDEDYFEELVDEDIEILEQLEVGSILGQGVMPPGASLTKTSIFSEFDATELADVIERMNMRNVVSGDYVYKEGDQGQLIYIVISGAGEELSHTKYDEEIRRDTLTEGDFFGEQGYFSSSARRSEVRALTGLELLEIDRVEMAELTVKHPRISKIFFDFYKDRVLVKTLALSKIFKHLTPDDRLKLLETVRVESVPEGTLMIKDGDQGHMMYVIISGSAQAWKLAPGGKKVSLVHLFENDYFGEVAVMLNRERTANVTALSKLDLIVIDIKELEWILVKYPTIRSVLKAVASKHLKESMGIEP